MTDKQSATHPNADAFPPGLSGTALRALAHARIKSLTDLSKWTEADLSALHGMGPKGIRMLKDGLAQRGRRLRGD